MVWEALLRHLLHAVVLLSHKLACLCQLCASHPASVDDNVQKILLEMAAGVGSAAGIKLGFALNTNFSKLPAGFLLCLIAQHPKSAYRAVALHEHWECHAASAAQLPAAFHHQQ